MLKAQIFLALVLATSLATFSINLQEQTIEDHQYYSTVNGQATTYTQVPEKNGDWVYTHKAKIGDQEGNVVFDTTVGKNWQYVETATPLIAGETDVAVGQGRATLTKSKAVTSEKVKLGDEEFKNVAFQQSNQPNASANKQLLAAATHGFAINRQKSENFFQTLKESKIKLEEGGNGFSFYFSGKVNQLFFGVPQKFFAESKLEELDAKNALDTNSWIVALGTKGVQLDKVNKLAKQPKLALFDSTTKYIWAEDDLVKQIVTSLSDQGIVCADINTQHNQGVYNCNANGKAYPELSLTFSTYNTDGKDTQAYKLKNYVQKIEGATGDRLLIRKQANYNNAAITKVPSLQLKDQTNPLIILGTVFLENVYTYFNQENHTVSLAQAYNITPEAAAIDGTWRLWSLILGALVALGAIAAVLALLSKVPYNPSVQPTLPPVKQQPQQFIQQQQQPVYVTQSVVRPIQQQQPIYYVQSNSPQRFVQSSLPSNYQQFRQN